MNRNQKNSSRKNQRGGERWKTLLWPALIGIPVLAALIWFIAGLKPEALTSQEIIAKQDWTEKELTDTLARAFAPQSNRGSRREVMAHLRKQLQKYPEEKQREIRIKAITGAVGESLKQIRSMPEEEQDKMITAIHRQAEKTFKDAQTKDGREMLAQVRESEEGQALNAEISRVIFAEFSPEERRKFAPITEIWSKTLRL